MNDIMIDLETLGSAKAAILNTLRDNAEPIDVALDVPDKWHEKEVAAAWEKIKASENVYIQRWP